MSTDCTDHTGAASPSEVCNGEKEERPSSEAAVFDCLPRVEVHIQDSGVAFSNLHISDRYPDYPVCLIPRAEITVLPFLPEQLLPYILPGYGQSELSDFVSADGSEDGSPCEICDNCMRETGWCVCIIRAGDGVAYVKDHTGSFGDSGCDGRRYEPASQQDTTKPAT